LRALKELLLFIYHCHVQATKARTGKSYVKVTLDNLIDKRERCYIE